ncbi:unnamed protein product [Rotaria sordida]|uniref:Uncharacterized protein n=1 Tax=Rotaria sordida TaxID=392033 RepID=A0A819RV00_9BILA|nr:unnamed protein product [Rotaria sordida]CAF4049546.1 unnamed protein product [Rotaria sordida]
MIGEILVFLPGWNEIVKCTQLLEIFDRPPHPTLRKVILSRSISERCITINDLVYVIDSGRTKARRADRTQSGECYRLFTRCNQRLSFVDFPQGEMITSRLDKIYLQGKLLNVNNVKTFLQNALYPPSIEPIQHAEQFLYDIGAFISHTNQLTPIGKILPQIFNNLFRLPMAPQIGKLLIMDYLFSCFHSILTIPSILTYRDPQSILRLELFFQSPPKDNNLQQSYANEFQNNHDRNQENYFLSKQNQSVEIKILTIYWLLTEKS